MTMDKRHHSFKFSIGGHVIAVESEESLSLANNEAFARFASDGEPQWRVCFGCQVAPPPEDAVILYSFVFEEIKSHCLFQMSGEDYYYTMLSAEDGSPLVIMHYRRGDDEVQSTAVDDFDALRFSLWFAINMLSASTSLTFVHSSTVVYGGRAVMFLGESGTGKSTHTRLWLRNFEGAHLLNDDSPMLEVHSASDRHGAADKECRGGGSILVHGSPWSGKTPCYIPRSFPLAAIVRLSQAPHNSIRRLPTVSAIGALQPSLPPALAHDDYFADLMMDIISAVIFEVPVYHLECLPDDAAARLSFQTIFGRKDG